MRGSFYKSRAGTALYFENDGGHGPCVVYLHGFGASRESWNDIRPFLTRGAQHYFVDLKGFGASDKPDDGRYAPQDQAALIEEFVTANQLSDLTLVGHSYGGGIAILTYLRLAERTPQILPKLVLIDSAGYPQELPFFVSILRKPFLRELVVRLISARLRARTTLRGITHDTQSITESRVERYAKYFDAPGAHQAFIATARQIADTAPEDVAKRIPEIRSRVLLIWGREDPVIPLALARRFQRELPDARLTILDSVGHVPQEESPHATASSINAFMNQP